MKFLFLLALLYCPLGLRAQAKPQGFNLTVRYTLLTDGTCKRIRLKTVLPQSKTRLQHIESIEFNEQPNDVYCSEATKFALYDFVPSADVRQLVIHIKGTAYANDYATRRKHPAPCNEDLSAWQQAEDFIECNSPEIKAQAQKLKRRIEGKTLRNIFRFVQENFSYMPNDNNLGALGMLRMKRGDCTEFTDLFVALCRAAGFPARHTYGIAADGNGKAEPHSWAEVYMKACGWVAFDPTPGNRADFATLNKTYVQFSQARNSAELGNKWLFSFWQWWGQNPPTVRIDYLSGQ